MCYLKDDTERAASASFQSKIDAIMITALPILRGFYEDDSLGYEAGGEEVCEQR
jgi:hypothetical protein